MVTIEARATGRRRALAPAWQIPIGEHGAGFGPLTLRELIARIVDEEVEAFRERRRDRRLVRVVSREEIELGLEAGRVSAGGTLGGGRVDEEEAVAVAHQAFEDGVYLVLIDGRQHETLEDQVLLSEDSTVTFLRLVALVGG